MCKCPTWGLFRVRLLVLCILSSTILEVMVGGGVLVVQGGVRFSSPGPQTDPGSFSHCSCLWDLEPVRPKVTNQVNCILMTVVIMKNKSLKPRPTYCKIVHHSHTHNLTIEECLPTVYKWNVGGRSNMWLPVPISGSGKGRLFNFIAWRLEAGPVIILCCFAWKEAGQNISVDTQSKFKAVLLYVILVCYVLVLALKSGCLQFRFLVFTSGTRLVSLWQIFFRFRQAINHQPVSFQLCGVK